MKKHSTLSIIVISHAVLFPADLFGQKGKGGRKSNDVYIVLSCIEYIGDGEVVAHFGYENTGKKTVVIDENGSVESLDIIPGYDPPEGGKEYNTRIGAELTSLFNAYSYNPATFTGDPSILLQHCSYIVRDLKSYLLLLLLLLSGVIVSARMSGSIA